MASYANKNGKLIKGHDSFANCSQRDDVIKMFIKQMSKTVPTANKRMLKKIGII